MLPYIDTYEIDNNNLDKQIKQLRIIFDYILENNHSILLDSANFD